MTSPSDLIALQELDLRRDVRRAQIADIDARLGETEELVTARENLTAAEAEADALRRRQHDLDGQLQDLDAKIQPLEKKLYDGSVRNPKELSDMQRELASLQARRGVLDDEGLSLIEATESATSALAAAKAEVARAEDEWQEDQEDLTAARAQAEAESDHLLSERDLWTKSIDAPTLGLYERLRTSRQGRAVARVERTICQGCRISLPSHLIQRMRMGTILVQCPSCERILVSAQT